MQTPGSWPRSPFTGPGAVVVQSAAGDEPVSPCSAHFLRLTLRGNMASWEKSHEIPNINGGLWSFMEVYGALWRFIAGKIIPNHLETVSVPLPCSINGRSLVAPGFPGQQQQGNSRATTTTKN